LASGIKGYLIYVNLQWIYPISIAAFQYNLIPESRGIGEANEGEVKCTRSILPEVESTFIRTAKEIHETRILVSETSERVGVYYLVH
jgi:hypothetical protein